MAPPKGLRQLKRLGTAAALALVCTLGSGAAHGTIVERVVAVVDNRPILLSDLREQAKPFLVAVHERVPAGAQRAAAISEVYKAVLDRMIDEELQRRAAAQLNISVSAEEVDRALTRHAQGNGITEERLLAEAARAGISERQYREQFRRQLLEYKLMEMRLAGRVRVSEDDMRAAYQRLAVAERRKLTFRAAQIVLRGSDAEQRALGEDIARQARSGTDFAELARRHSTDPGARSGGLLPTVRPGQLAEQLDRVALSLLPGEVSSPIRVGDQIVILKLLERGASSLPSYEEARAELRQRVYAEKLDTAKRHWLKSLRQRTHVEVRL
jgi:peptidyl-prolyl cis-trans isomerase SurA